MFEIPVQVQQRLIRFILTGAALSYAVACSIAGLHYADLSDPVAGVLAVPLIAIAILFFVRDFRSRSGPGTLSVVSGEIRVECRGRTLFRVSTEQLNVEFGAFVHRGGSGTGSPSRGSWNGPAVRLSSPKSKRKLTAVSSWQSLRACNSKTTRDEPLWANHSFDVLLGDIRLEGEQWDQLLEALAIGTAGPAGGTLDGGGGAAELERSPTVPTTQPPKVSHGLERIPRVNLG
jgi:hypothetical protein